MSTANPDREAGGLPAVPMPPPRGSSFTHGSLPRTPSAASSDGGGNSSRPISRSSSACSVNSDGGRLPRSSSFTRSRKFARGEVMTASDARHILESAGTSYAATLKFAAAQQLLSEHPMFLPRSKPQSYKDAPEPEPSEGPLNRAERPEDIPEPPPIPERLPGVVIKKVKKRVTIAAPPDTEIKDLEEPLQKDREQTLKEKYPKGVPGHLSGSAAMEEPEEPSTPPQKASGAAVARRSFAGLFSKIGRPFGAAVGTNGATNEQSSPPQELPSAPLPAPLPSKEEIAAARRARFQATPAVEKIHIPVVASKVAEPKAIDANEPKETAPTATPPKRTMQSIVQSRSSRASTSGQEQTTEEKSDPVQNRPQSPFSQTNVGKRLARARTHFFSGSSSSRVSASDAERAKASSSGDIDPDNEKVKSSSRDDSDAMALEEVAQIQSTSKKKILVPKEGSKAEADRRARILPRGRSEIRRSKAEAKQAAKEKEEAERNANVDVKGKPSLEKLEDYVDTKMKEAGESSDKVEARDRIEPRPIESKALETSRENSKQNINSASKTSESGQETAISSAAASPAGTPSVSSPANSPALSPKLDASSSSAGKQALPRVMSSTFPSTAEPLSHPDSYVPPPGVTARPRRLTIRRSSSAKISSFFTPDSRASSSSTANAPATAASRIRRSSSATVPSSRNERPVEVSARDHSSASLTGSASAHANLSPGKQNPTMTAFQKSIAKAQAASASLVARARALPRGVTIARMQGSAKAQAADAAQAEEASTGRSSTATPRGSVGASDNGKRSFRLSLRSGDSPFTKTKSEDRPVDKTPATGNTAQAEPEPAKSKKSIPSRGSFVSKQKTPEDGNTKPDRVTETRENVALKTKEGVILREGSAVSQPDDVPKEQLAYVTIKRVIRRTNPDGTEETVVKRVRVRPTAVKPNGDVIIRRTMRRAKKDGSGEKETVTVEQLIPRRRRTGRKGSSEDENEKSKPDKETAGIAPRKKSFESGAKSPKRVDSMLDEELVDSAASSAGLPDGHKVSAGVTRSSVPRRASGNLADLEKNANRKAKGNLRDEDWSARYNALQPSKSKEAINLVGDESNGQTRALDKESSVPNSSFTMMQQGLPRGSSYHGREPFVHGANAVIRMPGKDQFSDISTLPVESTGRQSNSHNKNGKHKKKNGDRHGAPLTRTKSKAGDVGDSSGSVRTERASKKWPRRSPSFAGRRSSLTRVMSFDQNPKRRSVSNLNETGAEHIDRDTEGLSGNGRQRPHMVPKSSSVGGPSARATNRTRSQHETDPFMSQDRRKVRAAINEMMLRVKRQFSPTHVPPVAAQGEAAPA